MTKDTNILEGMDVAAILLAATFIWTPLFAVRFQPIPKVISGASEYANPDKKGGGIESARLTDWLLVVFGGLQLIVFGRQASIMRSQNCITDRQADIYERQASASEIAQRAFVTLNGVSARFDRNSQTGKWDGITVGIGFMNSGETATRWAVCRANISVQFANSTVTPEHSVFADIVTGKTYQLLIGAKNSIVGTSVFFRNIEGGLIDGYMIYVWGWIEYNDVFSATDRRRTEFSMHGRILVPNDGHPPQWESSAFGSFNGADDECLHKPKTPCRPYNPLTPVL